jgi:precorrin-6B methylase 2
MTVVGLLGHIFHALVKAPYVRLRRAFNRLMFDRRYGVRTEARVSARELGLPSPDLVDYSPYGWIALRRILPRSEVSPDDVFVDVGSGMGRVVLQAALHYPFRRVLGIEISSQLHEISVTNLASNKARLRCPQVELMHANALALELPDDVTVVFLYNPFTGATFQAFLDRLLRSIDRNPRVVRVIYANPKEEARLLATGRVNHVRSLRGWRPTPAWSISNSTRMYAVRPAAVTPAERPEGRPRHSGPRQAIAGRVADRPARRSRSDAGRRSSAGPAARAAPPAGGPPGR